MMKFAAVVAVALALASECFAEEELQSSTTYLPSNCQQFAKEGDNVVVHYTGVLYPSGKKFDSTLDRNQPFEFPLGAHKVIKGWESGVKGMCVGEKRQLIIPPKLAYGDRNIGDGLIPPQSTLKFDIELLRVE